MQPSERLEQAITSGDVRKTRSALAGGADPNQPLNGAGHTALALAAAAGHLRVVEALLEAGAKILPGQTTTPLHAAASAGHGAILQLLLAGQGKRSINRFDAEERTPLMCAVQAGHIDAARLLIEAGADVDARRDPRFGNTALRHAAAEGSFDMVKLLLDAGADPLLPGRMLVTPLDRVRLRNTPEGRRINVMIERRLAAAAPERRKRR